MYVYNGTTATFADCQIYSNTAGTVSLCPHSIPWPHGRSVPELTPCPWDAMPHQLTRRCSMYAAARYPPFHGPTWKKFPGSVPCARREVAWRSSTARPPSPTVRSLRTLHLSRYAAARYAPFHGPNGRRVQVLTSCVCACAAELRGEHGSSPTVPHSMAPMEEVSRKCSGIAHREEA